MTGFKKKFTESNVFDTIKKHSDIITVRQIAESMKCSKQTVEALLKNMLVSGKVKRVNVGTDKKKTWIYSRCKT